MANVGEVDALQHQSGLGRRGFSRIFLPGVGSLLLVACLETDPAVNVENCRVTPAMIGGHHSDKEQPVRVTNDCQLLGKTFRIGDTLEVLYTTDTNEVNDLSVYLVIGDKEPALISSDGTLDRSNPGWGRFRWVIPDSLNYYGEPLDPRSERVRFLIVDYPQYHPWDESATFRITD